MSLLVVDHGKIMQRVLDILQNTDSLCENDDKTKVLRKFKRAESDYGITDDVMPYVFIRAPPRLAFTRESLGSGEAQYNQQFADYQLTVMVQHKSVEFVQDSLFFFSDEIVRAIKANPTLKDPVTDTDPLVKRTLIKDITRFKPKEGTEQDGLTFHLQVQIGVLWTLTFPNSGPLVLDGISKPLETVGNVSDTDLEDDGTIAESKISDPGLLDFEFESNDANDITLKALIGSGDEIPATLVTPTGTRAMTVYLREIRKPTQQDIIEKSVLSMKIIA